MPQNSPRGAPPCRVVRHDRYPAAISAAPTLCPASAAIVLARRTRTVAHAGTANRSGRNGARSRSGCHPGQRLRDEVPGRGGQADAGALVPARVHEPRQPRVRADHRQVVGAVRPEPEVAAQQVHLGEEREQPDRLRGEASAAPAGTSSGRSRPARGWRRSARCPPGCPRRPPRPPARRRRSPRWPRSRRCRPCAGSSGGSGSVTRMNPRRGSTGTGAPASAARSPPQVPAALTTRVRGEVPGRGPHARHGAVVVAEEAHDLGAGVHGRAQAPGVRAAARPPRAWAAPACPAGSTRRRRRRG